jgi:molybdopterin converting factor small subunit
MSVNVNVHYFLPHLTNDQDVVEVKGNTISQCMEQLVARFPGAREWLFGKDGNLSNLIDVYVNQESVYPEGLAKPVKDGDEIRIIMMISGG